MATRSRLDQRWHASPHRAVPHRASPCRAAPPTDAGVAYLGQGYYGGGAYGDHGDTVLLPPLQEESQDGDGTDMDIDTHRQQPPPKPPRQSPSQSHPQSKSQSLSHPQPLRSPHLPHTDLPHTVSTDSTDTEPPPPPPPSLPPPQIDTNDGVAGVANNGDTVTPHPPASVPTLDNPVEAPGRYEKSAKGQEQIRVEQEHRFVLIETNRGCCLCCTCKGAYATYSHLPPTSPHVCVCVCVCVCGFLFLARAMSGVGTTSDEIGRE